MPTKLKVIMFTDRAFSSESALESGDAIRARVTQRQEQFTYDVAAETRGFVVKSLGDGHLLTFERLFGKSEGLLSLTFADIDCDFTPTFYAEGLSKHGTARQVAKSQRRILSVLAS